MTEEKEPLRDTGKHPKISDEKNHMSNARAFDTLAEANLRLVKTLYLALFIIVACAVLGFAMNVWSAYMLRMGQVETRSLIRDFMQKRSTECPSK